MAELTSYDTQLGFVGQTWGSGLFGISASITYNQQTGEPQINIEGTFAGVAVQYSYTDSGGSTIAAGAGYVTGAGAGGSAFLGISYDTNTGSWGLRESVG